MNTHGIRFFGLSSPAAKSGLSCDADGAFIDDIPLLKSVTPNGQWIPRSCDEISNEISSRYGLPIDLSSRAGGLDVIARALNAGDVARAQIAAVLLAIPEPPPLSKGVPSPQAEQFIRELFVSGLIKADWNPDKHPRWPAGSPDSRGGEFAPKGETFSNGSEVGDDTSRDGLLESGRTDLDAASSGDLVDATLDGRSESASLVPAVENGEDGDLFEPVAYRGYFHDEVVEGLAQDFRDHGYKVETELPIEMADGSGQTRIDILLRGPNGLVGGIEVKTGFDPPLTEAQLYVYPHLMMGNSVRSPNMRIRTLGLAPMTLLPPIPVMLYYVKDENSESRQEFMDPRELLRELMRRIGARRIRKFEWQLLIRNGGLQMRPEDQFRAEYEDPSMIALDFMGSQLVASREFALALAEMLLKECCEPEYAKLQLPLRISDVGDRWAIEGSLGSDYSSDPPRPRMEIEIRKRNCQVTKFTGNFEKSPKG